MDSKTENEIWKEYRKTKSIKLRDKLMLQYAPLVKYVAGKVSINMPDSIDYDDLVSFGTFGLLDAISKFDPSKDVKFKTYAVTRIRGTIFDELRAIDWVPRSIRQKSKEVDEATQKLEARLGRTATDREIADYMNISMSEYNKIVMKVSGSALLSLNDSWNTSENKNESVNLMSHIESPGSLQPDIMAERADVKRVIIEAIKELPEKEKRVLVLYYYEDLTLKEIGAVLDVTESRVSQLHTKSIARLRAKLTNSRRGIQ